MGSSVGELAAGVALAGVVVLGVTLGVDGTLSVGQLTAFLFLVTLFIQPVQIATEVLNEAQNAIAGWRRVLDVLDVAPDVADPGEQGRELPAGPLDIRFAGVRFAYPGGPPVLHDIDLEIPAKSRVAVVGETGQRQDDVREAAHPADGSVGGRGAAVRGAAVARSVSARCAPGW